MGDPLGEPARCFGEVSFEPVGFVNPISLQIGGIRAGRASLRTLRPAAVHYGRAQALRDQRTRVLAAAYAATPERFVRGVPQPPTLPSAAWINKPTTEEVAH